MQTHINNWPLLTRSQYRVSDTMVTVKARGPLLSNPSGNQCKYIARPNKNIIHIFCFSILSLNIACSWLFLNKKKSHLIESLYVFSSPELKAQVSFSDHLSSGVCPSVRPSVRLSVCKLFTFSSSSPEPLGQFQPNLAQNILGWREFKFVQMKGPALFQGEIITK